MSLTLERLVATLRVSEAPLVAQLAHRNRLQQAEPIQEHRNPHEQAHLLSTLVYLWTVQQLVPRFRLSEAPPVTQRERQNWPQQAETLQEHRNLHELVHLLRSWVD